MLRKTHPQGVAQNALQDAAQRVCCALCKMLCRMLRGTLRKVRGSYSMLYCCSKGTNDTIDNRFIRR